MYPILFEIGPVVVPSWHVLFLVGAISAYLLFVRVLAKHSPEISDQVANGVYVSAYVGGYFGARLLSIFVDQPEVTGFGASILELFKLGPMTFYGGAIGAFVCGAVYAKAKRASLATILDAAMPAGMVGMAFGRIGCFLNGDDFGKSVNIDNGIPWWAVTFPNLEDNIPRYPVQLLCMAFGFLIAIILLRYFTKLRSALGAGAVGVITIAAYANFRFLIEFWRGDPRGSVFEDLLSTSQFISLLVLAVTMVAMAIRVLAKKPEKT